ncbi:hypothetical protein E3A20_15280 [Planctomyces bekefii]|uniref:Uncharacterized protein n=1 Tax=Planctomyces bekefii TaxID=1653850 RepID=A0A5C6M3L8_9PLAN|nr:hypothetical protein E3A20_15280 [Planctomyces bekefii]
MVWGLQAAVRRSSCTSASRRNPVWEEVPGNAAAALLGCRQIWNLSVSDAQLHEVAAGLGSDINFLLSGARGCDLSGAW